MRGEMRKEQSRYDRQPVDQCVPTLMLPADVLYGSLYVATPRPIVQLFAIIFHATFPDTCGGKIVISYMFSTRRRKVTNSIPRIIFHCI